MPLWHSAGTTLSFVLIPNMTKISFLRIYDKDFLFIAGPLTSYMQSIYILNITQSEKVFRRTLEINVILACNKWESFQGIQFRLRSTSQWIARIRVHLRANAIDRDQLSAWKTLLKCNAVLPYEMSPSVGDSLLFYFCQLLLLLTHNVAAGISKWNLIGGEKIY